MIVIMFFVIFVLLFIKVDIICIDYMVMNVVFFSEYWFGMDINGWDVFVCILYGGRILLLIGVVCIIFVILIGIFIGLIVGYYGGKVD